MLYSNLINGFARGKEKIALGVVIITLSGLIFETITLFESYPVLVLSCQILAIFAHVVGLIFFLLDKAKYSCSMYAICIYAIIAVIIINNIAYYIFPDFQPNELQSNVMQDVVVFIMFTTLSGFLLSKKHIFIQAAFLILLILFHTLFFRSDFFIENVYINIIATVGYSSILYYLVKTANNFSLGLQEVIQKEIESSAILQDRTTQMKKYQTVMYKLSKVETLYSDNLDGFYALIAKAVGESMRIERVSIWLFNDEMDSLERKVLRTIDGKMDSIQFLKKSDYPTYFNSIKDKIFLAVEDAHQSYHNSEYKASYLLSLDVHSLLDCVFKSNGRPAGIICCETVGHTNKWTNEDILFVQAICDFISIVNKNIEIKELIMEINSQNYKLEEQNNANNALNEELNSLNEELTTVNENLEKIVKERTQEIAGKNKVLTEYAFINSHLLRAPIARILGLSDLILREVESVQDQRLVSCLEESTHELDKIVKNISDMLYSDNKLTSLEVKEIIRRNQL